MSEMKIKKCDICGREISDIKSEKNALFNLIGEIMGNIKICPECWEKTEAERIPYDKEADNER